MVLPSGFVVPPLPYLAVLLVATAAVVALLARERPPMTARTAVAFAPWMAVGSTLYVCYQVDVVPAAVAPLASAPAVYLTTFAVAGAVWPLARRTESPLRVLAGVGLIALAAPVLLAVRYGTTTGSLRPLWPALALVVAVALTALTWAALSRVWPRDASVVGAAGALAVFGHALDGTTTAVGVDVLGFGEQTPLSRAVMDAAAALPTASTLGVGWLFVLVKLALAVVVVRLLADYVRDEPAQGYLLLAVVAAVGLGPGAHNLLLFTIAS